MRTFHMTRDADESGVSGIGKVLEGAIFNDGTCVIRWCTQKGPSNTAIYNSFEDFQAIHITSHPTNGAKILWDAVIPEEEHKNLIERDERLSGLEARGVDNWEGY